MDGQGFGSSWRVLYQVSVARYRVSERVISLESWGENHSPMGVKDMNTNPWISPAWNYDKMAGKKLPHSLWAEQMSSDNPFPAYIINSVAPIRICDNGGWTDTWFAGHGRIFNIGVYPYVEVQVAVHPADRLEQRILIHAENFGDRYVVSTARRANSGEWGPHPLLEAAIEFMRLPENLALEVTIFSQAPAGASTGTSAAVSVALIGALDQLTPGRMTPHEIALAAQRIETEMLHQQCGIQDQLCSAYGGISYIEMNQYPHASVSPINIPNATWWELERRLVLIYLGNAHNSSQVHEMVIQGLEDAGPDCPQLEALRQTAPRSRDALYSGDFQALAQAMIENTEAQRFLHPALVSSDAERVIKIARQHGAIGWKVNGAGGQGGSLTLLCGPRSAARRAMIAEIEAEKPAFRNIPIYLSRSGLRVWKHMLD
jgi:D-glycero-alpha-D-manno-heptose-7-phosphate kinase